MRLILVSNRLPISITVKGEKFRTKPSSGGLATGLSSYLETARQAGISLESLWVGWAGNTEQEALPEKTVQELWRKNIMPISLSDDEIENFYNGFCNNTIWPLFHYFPSYASYDKEEWATYRRVNEHFRDALLPILQPDDEVWIHDYQLMLLPALLREKFPQISIGFFLHIPFPVFEVFRLLPKKWCSQILHGLMGADLIGFHTYDYSRHFLGCIQRILGYEHNLGLIETSSRTVQVDTFPMGIDFAKFHNALQRPAVQKEITQIQETAKSSKIIISVDRLDYTKGIINRLRAYELFLQKYPSWQEAVKLVLVVVPSRTDVSKYQEMKKAIDEMVGKINGAFGTIHWTPIAYQFRSLSFQELTALYLVGDVALITPLRDGMNLVAKEYVASRRQGGVLILSEMTGAAQELTEALQINPNHAEEMADALHDALSMPMEEQQKRISFMQQRLRTYTITKWVDDFLEALQHVKNIQTDKQNKQLTTLVKGTLVKDFQRAQRRLLLLDYDGTLVSLKKMPSLAFPDAELMNLLQEVSSQPRTQVVIVSGRDKQTLVNWLDTLKVDLVAEHGIWHRLAGGEWHTLKKIKNDWKKAVAPILESYTDRLPGAFLEEKDFSFAWHYRAANPELAPLRAKELLNTLTHLTANLDVQTLLGNKVIEVRPLGTGKGDIVHYYTDQKPAFDFILAIGDDTTDEDLFKALPDFAYTVRVGETNTRARFIVDDYLQVRELLQRFLPNQTSAAEIAKQ